MTAIRPLSSDSTRRKVLESMVARQSQGRPRLPRRGRQGMGDLREMMRGEAPDDEDEIPDPDDPERRKTRREAKR